ncbi:capsid [Circovirus sp.]|nr:capsid [Circovirus sp.]
MGLIMTRALVRQGARQSRLGAYFGAAKAGYSAANKVAPYVKKMMQSRSIDKGPARVVPSAPITYQNDNRCTYRRKRAPARVRRAGRKAAYRFKRQLGTLLGNRMSIFNGYGNATASAGNQCVSEFLLMDANAVSTLFNEYGNTSLPTSTTGTAGVSSAGFAFEMMIKGMRQEIEYLNSDTSFMIFVDLYYYYPRKDTIQTGLAAAQSDSGTELYYDQGPGTTPLVNPTGLGVMGWTPFHSPAFVQNFVVYKTERVILQPGQSFTFLQKCSKVSNHSVRDWEGLRMRRKVSTGVIACAQGNVYTTGTTTSTRGVTVSYHNQQWASVGSVAKNASYTLQALTTST